ncbi:hypothetical protein A2533_04280 [Candidatus Falkowbacteria bacterium RIFOXYD2_FULL_35_9]|uniref:Uncharacterized protein n=1 Tax=Candidatus Falkowbacteria bacterium RIFOXYC2_FULL_36_12 TaxID=1798002 RepID=A0A1F5SYV4_9BACT|nr:MAG: hypothetical protein A2300_03555 [Candidatus Falkowbacteria bacterium RIFOXYB2_FULL_35_7]OGF31905.1 MAG: hypothetical protein A2478_05500 [Candidatus Falkowbacteria bacterium RIFOXYC2_FULL_36_12]OGF34668.1 MAG: hypothetical protein A2223_02895 [Candidatus Falkowbacteria bacterium RIFOXYA2_FULL_35_8]OGF46108.1 MAG: hypothetical protein A2533_04280 [Candidatus Falkowbacteria bacterium RIFOXYD2_FULL_35_9]
MLREPHHDKLCVAKNYMRLSQLQKYILLKCYYRKNSRLKRDKFIEFYKNNSKAKKYLQQKIITGSIETLINKELLIGYGRRTPHKWFIEEVKLTAKGFTQTQKLLGEQKKLPLK